MSITKQTTVTASGEKAIYKVTDTVEIDIKSGTLRVEGKIYPLPQVSFFFRILEVFLKYQGYPLRESDFRKLGFSNEWASIETYIQWVNTVLKNCNTSLSIEKINKTYIFKTKVAEVTTIQENVQEQVSETIENSTSGIPQSFREIKDAFIKEMDSSPIPKLWYNVSKYTIGEYVLTEEEFVVFMLLTIYRDGVTSEKVAQKFSIEGKKMTRDISTICERLSEILEIYEIDVTIKKGTYFLKK